MDCKVEWCGEPVVVKKRQLCRKHYNFWKHHGHIDALPPRADCVECGEPVARPKAGPLPSRCEPCRADRIRGRARDYARSKPSKAKPPASRSCYVCGAATAPTKWPRKKCDRCSRVSTSVTCAEGGCDSFVKARGICGLHYRRWEREQGKIAPKPWDDSRRAAYHKRRALKAGSKVGPAFTNAEVFARDGWTCGLCGSPVSPGAVYPDPLSPSLDHIVPLSRGGAHSLDNSQLAHLSCNVRKGARQDFTVSG